MAHQFPKDSLIAEVSHDGGHSLTAMGLALALVWFGVSDVWATVWAAGIIPLALELRDMMGLSGIDPRRWTPHWPRPGWDNLRDLVTYAGPLTALYLLTHGARVAGMLVAVATGAFMVWYYRRSHDASAIT